MKPTDFSKSLSDYLCLYLPNERGFSRNTICSYRDTFMLFINYMKNIKGICAEKLTLFVITQESIISFLCWLQKERKCSDSTRNARLAAIHSFFRYLQYRSPNNIEEWQKILSIPIKRMKTPLINYLSLDGIKLLLAQPRKDNAKGCRDLALISLIYDSGARVQELIDLTPSAFNFTKPYTIRLYGKGNKGRIVPLMDAEVDILKEYMNTRHLLESYACNYILFDNGRGDKLTRMAVNKILAKYARLAKKVNNSLIPERVTPHVLRHSKAMHLLQAGVNLVYIRDFLGHTSITTTEVYARADGKLKREALEKAYVETVEKNKNGQPSWMIDSDLLEWLKSL